MIRRFLKDTRGNFAMMTAISMVPIMGSLALAIDYGEMSRQRQDTMNALDAAGIATARRIVDGKGGRAISDAELENEIKAYAKDFFEANLASVSPANTALSVVLPQNNTGGGTLKLSATLKYQPYFFPVFAKLMGTANSDGTTKLDFDASAEIRLKNTLEVALVLDNSGSMDYLGSGTGQKRIVLLKAAAKQLIDTLAQQAGLMKQIEKPVQFGLVPFAASVNVGPTHDGDSWMDTTGISPIHHENFDWSKMTAANDPNKYAENLGGAWYKRGDGWGASKDQPLTRFSLYADVEVQSGREEVPNTRHYVCTAHDKKGKCTDGYWTADYNYTISQYASWQGCVEARPWPYNNNDATPTTSTPATLFVPMFAPDEAGHVWRDLNADGINDLNGDTFGYGNNWWTDWADTTALARQTDMRKYFRVKPYGSKDANAGDGPNVSCTTNPITPLKDVTTLEGKQAIISAIDAMQPGGNTNVPEGTAWGWRLVSSGEPFTDGRPDTQKGNDKVIIVLTDGANTYGDLGTTDAAGNKSTYAAYGYAGTGYNGTGTTRMFMDTSANIGKSNYSASNYTAALDEQMQKLCSNAKDANVLVMTVSLDLSDTNTDEKKAINALQACSSDSRFRKNADGTPKKLYWNATGSNLADKFKEIADELSNLRIVS
jgi:Flp pilus assembly protein TadG